MSQLQILIRDASVIERQVQTKNGAQVFREQVGWVDYPSGERRKVRVNVPRAGEPYKPGAYTVGINSYNVNQWGDLELARQLELVPAVAVAAPLQRQAG